MDNGRSGLRWGVEKRLEFIEFRLFWGGHRKCRDLMDQFGISVNQSSSNLNRCIDLTPDNMVYDKNVRTYVRDPHIMSRYLKLDASQYLAQLRLVADGTLDRKNSWMADLSPFAFVSTPVRDVNQVMLQSIGVQGFPSLPDTRN